ncbi:hypothetical protein AAMO2058_000014500 [Amorphochlora amoebiformis]
MQTGTVVVWIPSNSAFRKNGGRVQFRGTYFRRFRPIFDFETEILGEQGWISQQRSYLIRRVCVPQERYIAPEKPFPGINGGVQVAVV